MKTWTDARGEEHEFTKEQLVERYLTGYVDYYSGGRLEHLQDEVQNLRTRTAELLVRFCGEELVEFCEKELP